MLYDTIQQLRLPDILPIFHIYIYLCKLLFYSHMNETFDDISMCRSTFHSNIRRTLLVIQRANRCTLENSVKKLTEVFVPNCFFISEISIHDIEHDIIPIIWRE